MGPRLTKYEYEGLVLKALHRSLIERDHGLRFEGKILVEEIRLDAYRAPSDASMLEVLFRDETRHGCLFGWRFPATDADADALEGFEHQARWGEGVRGPEQAENWANTIALTNFEEEIEAVGYGLPSECDPGDVTWVGDYKPCSPRVGETDAPVSPSKTRVFSCFLCGSPKAKLASPSSPTCAQQCHPRLPRLVARRHDPSPVGRAM